VRIETRLPRFGRQFRKEGATYPAVLTSAAQRSVHHFNCRATAILAKIIPRQRDRDEPVQPP
jgi:hypothetical protein